MLPAARGKQHQNHNFTSTKHDTSDAADTKKTHFTRAKWLVYREQRQDRFVQEFKAFAHDSPKLVLPVVCPDLLQG
jgi:hypothetical protein